MLLRCSSRMERGDRGSGGGGEDRGRLDELRLIVTPRALDDRCDERDVARRAERSELPQAEPVGKDDDHLPNAITKRRVQRAQRLRVGLVARAENVEHRGGNVEKSATIVVRRHEAARAKTFDERVGHRRTILPAR